MMPTNRGRAERLKKTSVFVASSLERQREFSEQSKQQQADFAALTQTGMQLAQAQQERVRQTELQSAYTLFRQGAIGFVENLNNLDVLKALEDEMNSADIKSNQSTAQPAASRTKSAAQIKSTPSQKEKLDQPPKNVGQQNIPNSVVPKESYGSASAPGDLLNIINERTAMENRLTHLRNKYGKELHLFLEPQNVRGLSDESLTAHLNGLSLDVIKVEKEFEKLNARLEELVVGPEESVKLNRDGYKAYLNANKQLNIAQQREQLNNTAKPQYESAKDRYLNAIMYEHTQTGDISSLLSTNHPLRMDYELKRNNYATQMAYFSSYKRIAEDSPILDGIIDGFLDGYTFGVTKWLRSKHPSTVDYSDSDLYDFFYGATSAAMKIKKIGSAAKSSAKLFS